MLRLRFSFPLAPLLCLLSIGSGPVTAERATSSPDPNPAPLPAAGGDSAAYERAASLRERHAGKVFHDRIGVHWLEEGARFWFRHDFPDGHRFRQVQTATGDEAALFDHEKLARALSENQGEPVDPERLPFRDLKWNPGEAMRFEGFGARWKATLPGLVVERLESVDETEESRRERRGNRARRGRDRRQRPDREASSYEAVSPDGAHVAYFRGFNVFIRKVDSGEEIQLSSNGSEAEAYGAPVFWAPDSRKLAVWKTRRGEERLVHYVDTAPDDQLQPKHFTRSYAKPGDHIDTRSPHIFTANWSSKHTGPDLSLMPNPFVTRQLEWDADGRAVRFEYIERGFGVHRVLELDSDTGRTRTLIDETSETFVDAFHKGFRRDLKDTGEILWTSERDGWNHLYLFDARSGLLKRQLTQGQWVVRGVEHVDEERREVIFRASGYYSGQDPYFIHFFRVSIDGGKVIPLTEANGHHSAQWAPDREHFVATWSRVDRKQVHELRSARDGCLVASLGEADISRLAEAGWRAPEVFVSKDRDGGYDLWGIIVRPSDFDPGRSYPVIEQIYAGPHSAFVPKAFRAFHRLQEMAELGFIVVKLDAKGTSHRSRDFHHFCHKNLGDSGFPDRIAWMKAAAAEHPQMDLSRVGIYGGSAGGQSALRALLAHGDFYKAAAADCGCHDNRMDKIWWNELWMDWPVGPHYAEQSNVTNAHRLQGHLLLTVGELDTNVDPASTMQVVDALIKADKDFEMLVFPGANHGVGESPYASRKRKDFFVRHLLGVEPRHARATNTGVTSP